MSELEKTEEIEHLEEVIGLRVSTPKKKAKRAKAKKKVARIKEDSEGLPIVQEKKTAVDKRDEKSLESALSLLGQDIDQDELVKKKLEEWNCDPLKNIADIANGGDSVSVRLRANEILLKKMYADKKSVDDSKNVSTGNVFNIQITQNYENDEYDLVKPEDRIINVN